MKIMGISMDRAVVKKNLIKNSAKNVILILPKKFGRSLKSSIKRSSILRP
jgi:DeoR/GlpR family transcriptional regulator of sugar metabolism